MRRRPTTRTRASRYPARSRTPFDALARWTGKMVLTDFCNRPSTRAPAMTARFPGRRGFRSDATRAGLSPRVGIRIMARLTALHELRPMRAHGLAFVRRRGERGPRPILVGSRSGEPSDSAPRTAALSSAGEACASTSDASCRDAHRSVRSAALRRGPPPPKPRQRLWLPHDPRRLPSTSARSALRRFRDGRPRTRTRHRCLGFAALGPASDALSPPRSREGGGS